jgi:hypothetical protein
MTQPTFTSSSAISSGYSRASGAEEEEEEEAEEAEEEEEGAEHKGTGEPCWC